MPTLTTSTTTASRRRRGGGGNVMLLPLAVAAAVVALAAVTAAAAASANTTTTTTTTKPTTNTTNNTTTTKNTTADNDDGPSTADTVLGPFTLDALDYAATYAASGYPDPTIAELNRLAALYQYAVKQQVECNGGGGSARNNNTNTTTKNIVGDPPSTTAVPVIAIPDECTALCSDLTYPSPGLFTGLCAGCLALFPALPSWPHEANFKTPDPVLKVDVPLARMPLAEAGYTALPSTPLLFPRRFVSFELRALGATDYALQALDQTNTNDAWAGGLKDPDATWTVDGKTLPIVSTTHTRVPENCVLKVGWVTPLGLLACPGTEPFNPVESDVHFPSLKAAADAIPLPYSNAEDYRRVAASQIVDAFASPDGAARAIFDSQQTAYATTLFIKNVTRENAPDRLAELQALYGEDEWLDEWTAIYDKGDLVEIDLTYTQGMQSSVPGGPWWNVAAHALFRAQTTSGHECEKQLKKEEKEEGKKEAADKSTSNGDDDDDGKEGAAKYDDKGAKKGHYGKPTCTVLRPLAIRLSNQPDDPDAAFVYTPEKSKSAYMLAALALRQAITQTAIWVGHVFNLHINNVAATLALYNRVDAANAPYFSSAPLRQILDWFADPTYVSEFHTFLFIGSYASGPGTAIGVPDLLTLWQRFAAQQGSTWASNMMPAQLKASGLSESRFRGDGPANSWDGLPGPAYQLKLRKIAGAYATGFVNAAYPDDAAVAADSAIQDLAATLCAADGSNLVNIRVPTDDDDGCSLDTRAKLAQFVGDWMSLISAHSSAHLQDFVFRIMNMPLQPPRLGRQDAPDPEGSYVEADYLDWIPTTSTMARQVAFFANFIATSWTFPVTNMVPSQQWQKGDVPVWKDDLPIYTGDNVASVNAAHVAFIRAVAGLYESVPRAGGFRDVVTNYQQPTRAPRVINI